MWMDGFSSGWDGRVQYSIVVVVGLASHREAQRGPFSIVEKISGKRWSPAVQFVVPLYTRLIAPRK